MRPLFESIVAIGLAILLFILVKKRKVQLKNIQNIVQSKFNREGWSVSFSSIENGTKFILYNRGRKSALLVFTKTLNFDVLRRSVVIALLNQAERIEIYHSMITPHVQRAVYHFNKNRKLHKMKLINFWRGTL